MQTARDGLALWRRNTRREATQWFAKHPVAAGGLLAANSAGRKSWEQGWITANSAADALREQAEGLRSRNTTAQTHERATSNNAYEKARTAGRASASGAGQALALAAAVLAEEAEQSVSDERATETAGTLDGIRTGLDAYTNAINALADTIAHRRGDRKIVKDIEALSEEVAQAAEAASKAHKHMSTLYSAQMEQEDATGRTMK